LGDEALRARLRALGYERAKQFTWDDAAAQYRALFTQLGWDG
jgi:hypothetical protein